MPSPALRTRLVIGVFAVVGVVAGFMIAGLYRNEQSLPEKGIGTPLPAPVVRQPGVSSTPYLNVGPEARYVGSAACFSCHENEHHSYERTGMSHSAVQVDPNQEPLDGIVDHPLSQRRYVVERRDGKLWHREMLRAADRAAVVLTEFPVAYRIGSGGHARTYLVEADGFLVESPITWYASQAKWGMSPGFDLPDQKGFERPIATLCLYCHVGLFDVEGQSSHRYRITEGAIGCERCHGPGSLHLARQTEGNVRPHDNDSPDYTIVNPQRLSRDLAEAVCQQCHLSGDVTVIAAGRKATDFRPGLPLAEFQHIYNLTEKGEAMTVTGHVAQLHQSRCYQTSPQLTCTTCHSPHGLPSPNERIAHYRAACLQCHSENACRIEPQLRREKSAEDSCIVCHMPRGATDVPHVSFSHHRIGIHTQPEPPLSPEDFFRRTSLVPFHDQSGLSELMKQQTLGLANGKAAMHDEIGPATEVFNQRAYDILRNVVDAGVRDGFVASTLARASYRLGQGNVEQYAALALQDPDFAGDDRCDMLFLLADAHFRRGDFPIAADLLRELTRLRRNAIDWSYLSRCQRAMGDEEQGLKSLEVAAEIGVSTPRLRQELVKAYRQRGDLQRAQWHQDRLPNP